MIDPTHSLPAAPPQDEICHPSPAMPTGAAAREDCPATVSSPSSAPVSPPRPSRSPPPAPVTPPRRLPLRHGSADRLLAPDSQQVLDGVKISVMEQSASLLAASLGEASPSCHEDHALAQPLDVASAAGQGLLAYQAAGDLLLQASVRTPERAEAVGSKLILAALEASDGPRLTLFCRRWADHLPDLMAHDEGYLFRVAAADPPMFAIVAGFLSTTLLETLLAGQRAEAFGLLLRAELPHSNLKYIFRHLRPTALESLVRHRSEDCLCAFSAWPQLREELEEAAIGRGMNSPWPSL